MIVAANNPLTDPLTIGVVPWAQQVMGGPAVQWTEQLNWANQPRIAFIGHGLGAGKITMPVGGDADRFVASLTAPDHAISDNTELQLWSCFSTSRKGRASLVSNAIIEDTTLVDRIHDSITRAGITGVAVSGGLGPVYTDTHRSKIISGPGIETTETIKTLVMQIEGHCWAQVGLGVGKSGAIAAFNVLTKKDWMNSTEGLDKCYINWPEPATSIVTHQPRTLRMGLRPDSLADAAKWHRITSIVLTGVDPKPVPDSYGFKADIVTAMRKWYELFFADPDIIELTQQGHFTVMHDFANAGHTV
jgi:hypothetical protein